MGGPQPKMAYAEMKESLQGVESLIPFWEDVIAQHSPDN